MEPVTLVFYLLATFTIGAAVGVVSSTNIVHSALALMGTLLGVAGTFVLLGADFLGVVQLLVYVGGILVLTLFAVMLTSRTDVRVSNRSVGRVPAGVLTTGIALLLGAVAWHTPWPVAAVGEAEPSIYDVGEAFLTDYLLPFEVASLVLLVALIGAVVVSRKEVRG